jgi:hypothetical protein
MTGKFVASLAAASLIIGSALAQQPAAEPPPA